MTEKELRDKLRALINDYTNENGIRIKSVAIKWRTHFDRLHEIDSIEIVGED